MQFVCLKYWGNVNAMAYSCMFCTVILCHVTDQTKRCVLVVLQADICINISSSK